MTTANWIPVIAVLLAPSLVMLALQLILAGFAPDLAERAKQHIPTVFLGVVLLGVAGALATAFLTAAGTP